MERCRALVFARRHGRSSVRLNCPPRAGSSCDAKLPTVIVNQVNPAHRHHCPSTNLVTHEPSTINHSPVPLCLNTPLPPPRIERRLFPSLHRRVPLLTSGAPQRFRSLTAGRSMRSAPLPPCGTRCSCAASLPRKARPRCNTPTPLPVTTRRGPALTTLRGCHDSCLRPGIAPAPPLNTPFAPPPHYVRPTMARHNFARRRLQAGRHRLRPCRTGLPPPFGPAPGGLRRSLRDRRRPPSAILDLHMDKTGRDGNSQARRRQARCRAMRSSNLGRHSTRHTRPPTRFGCRLFLVFRRRDVPPGVRNTSAAPAAHSRTPQPLRPSIRNAVFNGRLTVLRSYLSPPRVPSIQHGCPSQRCAQQGATHSCRATLRSLRPDTPCAFEGHTARQASTHRCRAPPRRVLRTPAGLRATSRRFECPVVLRAPVPPFTL